MIGSPRPYGGRDNPHTACAPSTYPGGVRGGRGGADVGAGGEARSPAPEARDVVLRDLEGIEVNLGAGRPGGPREGRHGHGRRGGPRCEQPTARGETGVGARSACVLSSGLYRPSTSYTYVFRRRHHDHDERICLRVPWERRTREIALDLCARRAWEPRQGALLAGVAPARRQVPTRAHAAFASRRFARMRGRTRIRIVLDRRSIKLEWCEP